MCVVGSSALTRLAREDGAVAHEGHQPLPPELLAEVLLVLHAEDVPAQVLPVERGEHEGRGNQVREALAQYLRCPSALDAPPASGERTREARLHAAVVAHDDVGAREHVLTRRLHRQLPALLALVAAGLGALVVPLAPGQRHKHARQVVGEGRGPHVGRVRLGGEAGDGAWDGGVGGWTD